MRYDKYNGLGHLVNRSDLANGKADALSPGEIRLGTIRFHPKTNDKGEAIVRLHVTNEVDMYLAKNRLAAIKACMWIVICALVLATGSGLIVFFHAH